MTTVVLEYYTNSYQKVIVAQLNGQCPFEIFTHISSLLNPGFMPSSRFI